MFMEDKMPVIALIIGVLLAAADQIIKYFVLMKINTPLWQ